MSTRQSRIEQIIKDNLKPLRLEVVNESHQHSVPANSETHFKVLVVADVFTGQSRIDRQRKVNDLLKNELQTGLHALTQRLLTQSEWEAQEGKNTFVSPVCGSKK